MTAYTRERPEGAIDMGDFIQLIANSWLAPVQFHRASKHFGYVETITFDKARLHFSPDEDSKYVYIGYRRKLGIGHHNGFSLLDTNLIENEYNDWYPFADEELAKKYAASGA